jgi:hypothetical protein
MSDSDLFVIDKKGDFTNANQLEISENQSDFISLNEEKPTRKPRKAFVKPKRQGPHSSSRKEDEEAIIRDYLENADMEDIRALAGIGRVASINMMNSSDNSDDQESESDDDSNRLHPSSLLAEQGYYDSLMQGAEDSWQDDDDDSDSEDDLGLEGIDIEYFDFKDETKALQNEIDSSSDIYNEEEDSLDDSKERVLQNSDSSDDERPRYANFTGGPSKWVKNQELMNYVMKEEEKERLFQKRLNAEFENEEDWKSSVPPTGKAQKRREKKDWDKSKKERTRKRAADRGEKVKRLGNVLDRNNKTVGKELFGYLTTMNEQIHRWAKDDGYGDCLVLPPMPSAVRKQVVILCKEYKGTAKIRGSGKKKNLLVFRTQNTHVPGNWKGLVQNVVPFGSKLQGATGNHQSKQKNPKKGKKAPSAADTASPKVGEVIGAKAAAIEESNIGHKMMRLMGWSPGQSLGTSGEGQIVDPIKVVIRGKRTGLGGT